MVIFFWVANFRALDFGSLVVLLQFAPNLGMFRISTWLGLGLGSGLI